MSGSFDGLPPLLAEIAEVAGLEAALKIAEKRGGQEVYLPAKVAQDHWLTETVGREAADKICKHFCVRGGFDAVIPLGPAGFHARLQASRRRRLAEEIATGATVAEVVRRTGVHERTVYRAKKKLKSSEDDSQGSLF